MLSTVQSETIAGIVDNYDKYVVYYYADYHDYQPGEVRDSRAVIYVGDDITVNGNTFYFGDDVDCYYFTYSKYLTPQSTPSEFTVEDSEIVYTNCVKYYPDLCYFESEYNNFDYNVLIIGIVLVFFAVVVLIRCIFGALK